MALCQSIAPNWFSFIINPLIIDPEELSVYWPVTRYPLSGVTFKSETPAADAFILIFSLKMGNWQVSTAIILFSLISACAEKNVVQRIKKNIQIKAFIKFADFALKKYANVILFAENLVLEGMRLPIYNIPSKIALQSVIAILSILPARFFIKAAYR